MNPELLAQLMELASGLIALVQQVKADDPATWDTVKANYSNSVAAFEALSASTDSLTDSMQALTASVQAFAPAPVTRDTTPETKPAADADPEPVAEESDPEREAQLADALAAQAAKHPKPEPATGDEEE